jgi:hypothetical protein
MVQYLRQRIDTRGFCRCCLILLPQLFSDVGFGGAAACLPLAAEAFGATGWGLEDDPGFWGRALVFYSEKIMSPHLRSSVCDLQRDYL